MPQNLFERAGKENALFKNERYLYPEFVPEKLEHRDAQIDTLVYAFNPILQGRKPDCQQTELHLRVLAYNALKTAVYPVFLQSP